MDMWTRFVVRRTLAVALCAMLLIGVAGRGGGPARAAGPAGLDAPVTVTLLATADATIKAEDPAANFGKVATLQVINRIAPSAPATDLALLQFDLGSLPGAAVIDAAQLELYQAQAGMPALAVTLAVHRVTGVWNEATVTWNKKPPIEDAASATAEVDGTVGVKTWNVTALARAWQGGPNHGLAVSSFEGPSTPLERVFYSREGSSRYPPRLALTYHLPCAGVSEIPRAECDALVDLYNSTNGPGWTDHTGWLATKTPCSTPWHGVHCAGGHVDSLVEYANNLTGNIPAGLDNLSGLERLELGANELTGVIPDSLGSLAKLTLLDLGNNGLTGGIPASLGHLASLVALSLSENPLGGTMPASLADLTSLAVLNLQGCGLSGSIPASLGNLPNLSEAWLNRNQFTGSIPASLGSITALGVLSLGNNQLTGSIPASLGSITALRVLGLGNNQLTGSIPPELGNLTNLQWLIVANNQLTGGIPSTLGTLTHFLLLEVAYNPMSGPLPQSLVNVPPATFDFKYDHTNLCEPRDAAFQTWLASLHIVIRTGVKCSNCSGDGVYLYAGTKLTGDCWKWTADDPRFSDEEGFHDLARSIKFAGTYGGSQYVATLYADENYAGAHSAFSNHDPDLSDDAIGAARADSIRVRQVLPCSGYGAYLYEGKGYAGLCRRFNTSEPDLAAAAFAGMASSLKLSGASAASAAQPAGGLQVTLCQAANYGGACSTFSADDPDLGDDAVGDDRAASLRVELVGGSKVYLPAMTR